MTFKKIKYWFPVIFWMGIIFWMSTGMFSSQNTSLIIEPILRFLMPGISPQTTDMIHGLIRKYGHITEYFVLGLLLFRAFRGSSKESRTWRLVFSAVIVLALYAASDEFHQSFVLERTASLVDIGIDTLGGIISQQIGYFSLTHTRFWRQSNLEHGT